MGVGEGSGVEVRVGCGVEVLIGVGDAVFVGIGVEEGNTLCDGSNGETGARIAQPTKFVAITPTNIQNNIGILAFTITICFPRRLTLSPGINQPATTPIQPR